MVDDLACNDFQLQGKCMSDILVPRLLGLIQCLEHKVSRLVNDVAKANDGRAFKWKI